MKKFLSTAKKGFIDPISLITLGILVVGLVVTTAIVKNPNISLDIRKQAASGETCRTSGGSCVPNSYVCSGGSYTMDCASGNKCGYGTCNPPPPSCSRPGASGLCASLTCCPGLTKVTGLYGYCQCSQTQACTPNSTRCDGNYQETCKANGSGYDRKTCQFGCANNSCKPPTAVTKRCISGTALTAPHIEEYQSGHWKTIQTCTGGCNSTTLECKTFVPLAQVPTTGTKPYGEECSQGSECKSGICGTIGMSSRVSVGSWGSPPEISPVPICQRTDAEVRSIYEQTYKAELAAQAVTSTIWIFGPANALRIANVTDDAATLIACAKGNQNACAYILPAIANPIPGMSLAAQYSDDITALSRSAANYFDEAASIMRLPDANNPAGWTLGTYGGQTSNQQIQQTIENYMLSRPPPNYTSALYQQTEVLNQPGFYGSFATESDPNLAATVDEIRTALGNPANYAEGMGMDDITQAIYNRNQSIYSQPLSNPWANDLLLHNEIQLAGSNPNLSPYGVTPLGDYFGTSPGCAGNICYENSILTQAVAATYGKNTLVGIFYDTTVSPPISHAAVLFLDNGILSVADPTHNFSGTLETYAQYLQNYQGYSNNIQFMTERIFIPKP